VQNLPALISTKENKRGVAVIDINWTMWVQLVNFFLLLGILHVLLYRPLLRVLDRRKMDLEGSRSRVTELDAQISEKMTAYQAQLHEAKVRGSQEKSVLRQQAAREEAQLLSGAHQQASERLQAMKTAVATDAETARQGLRRETDALAGQIASKILGRGV
jgi:F-type H+-transporting ATPase subunit b